MKSKLVIQQDVDLKSCPSAMRSQINFVARKGHKKLVPVFPVGTEFSGDHALYLVQAGAATPSDEECAKACGFTPEQIELQHVEYQMTSLGINSEDDRDLYRAGVILGYDEKLNYIHGPNWDAHQEMLKQLEAQDDI